MSARKRSEDPNHLSVAAQHQTKDAYITAVKHHYRSYIISKLITAGVVCMFGLSGLYMGFGGSIGDLLKVILLYF